MVRRFLTSVALIAVALPAWGQAVEDNGSPNQSSSPSPDDETAQGDEIVVTGKREPLYEVRDVTAGALGSKPLVDIPFSISAYDQSLIQNTRTRTLTELLKNDPSVQNFNFGGAYDYIAIRGFETGTTSSYRLDGLQITTLSDFPFEKLERVEVLKGASGFLFGFAEPGGTINYVSKRPTLEPFVSLEGEVSDQDGLYAHVDAGGPIANGLLGYRVNLAYEDVGDFSHFRDTKRYLASAAVDARLADGLILRLDGDYQDKKLAAQPTLPLTTAGTLPPKYNPRTLIGLPWLRYGSESYNLGVRVDYQFAENFSLISQIKYTSVRRDSAFPYLNFLEPDGDYSITPFLGPPETQNFNQLSHQTLVSGKFSTGGIGHDVTFGVFNSRLRGISCGYLPEQDAINGNLFNPIYPPETPFDPLTETGCPQRGDQFHIFASDTISLGERWRVIAGLRRVHYNSSITGSFVGSFEDTVITPTFALLYKPNTDATIYASYAESLQEGGTAPDDPTVVNRGEQLAPLKSRQYEVGAKARLFDGLNVTGALFQIEQPADYVDPTTNRFGRFGERRHRGGEITLSGQVTPQLAAVGGLLWLDAELNENADPAIDGNRPTAVADVQASLFLDYATPFVPGLNVTAGAYYIGERAFDTENTLDVGDHIRFDLGARYNFRIGRQPVLLRLTVDNLLDEFYWESVAYGGVTVGVPRTVRLSFQTDF